MSNADLIREATQAVDFDGPIGQYSSSGASVRDLVRSLRDALERAEEERDEALRIAQPIQREKLRAMQNAALEETQDECDRLHAENERLLAVIAELDPYAALAREEPA